MPPRTESSRSALVGAAWKAALLALVVGGGFVAFRWGPLAEHVTIESVNAIVEDLSASPYAVLILVLSYALLTPLGVPATVPLLAGGLLFGMPWGGVYNYVGIMAGAAVGYFLARGLGRDLVAQLIPTSQLERIERLLERHAFWSLLRVRFLPIPFALVNMGSALAGVRPAVFLGATALGAAPAAMIYTYFAAAVYEAAADARGEVLRRAGLAVLLILLLTLTPNIVAAVRRRWGG